MPLTLKPGTRVHSAVDSTELIAIKVPPGEIELTIGGVPAVLAGDDKGEGAAALDGHDGGTALGKRYTNTAATVELLCTKAGQSVPAVDGEVLALKEAKPLPASD